MTLHGVAFPGLSRGCLSGRLLHARLIVLDTISPRRLFITKTRAQLKLLHTWIILVIVKQRLVQISRIDGHTEDWSLTLAAIRCLQGSTHRPEKVCLGTRGL